MEFPEKRYSPMTEDIRKKTKINEDSNSKKNCLCKLGKNLLGLVFDFLDQTDRFTSVALVNKNLNSVCKFFENRLTHFQMLWDFSHFNMYKYDPKTLEKICQLHHLKKLTIKKESPINCITTADSVLINAIKECKWTSRLICLEIDVYQVSIYMIHFFNTLSALKSLKINSYCGTELEVLYLFRKFIDSENSYEKNRESNVPIFSYNIRTKFNEFEEILYHPLEKFYYKSKHGVSIFDAENLSIVDMIYHNKNLIAFQFFGVKSKKFFISYKSSETFQRPLKKFSIKSIEIIDLKSLSKLIFFSNLEHLHLELDFEKDCDLIAHSIKQHLTLKCLKIFEMKQVGKKETFSQNFLNFFKIISESTVKKIQIYHLLCKESQNCFLAFLQNFQVLEKLKIKISSMENLSDDFLMDCFNISKAQILNKIKRNSVCPNQFGILKINSIDFCNYHDAVYSIFLSESMLEVQNLTKIEYPDHSVIIDEISNFFLPVHKFFSDNLEDLHVLNKVKQNNHLQEVHLIVTKKLSFNNLVFFKMITRLSDYFVSVKIVYVLIEPNSCQLLVYKPFAEKILSLPNLEEFYLDSNKNYKFLLSIESDFAPSLLRKISVKNYYFGTHPDKNAFKILAISDVSYLEIINVDFCPELFKYLAENLKNNQKISTLILKNIKGDRRWTIHEFNNLIRVLENKKNMKELEITFDSKNYPVNFYVYKSLFKTVATHYLEFLKIYLENNPFLKAFNFYCNVTSKNYQEFTEIILNFCVKNSNLEILFAKPISIINCLNLFYENEDNIRSRVILLDINSLPVKHLKPEKIKKIVTENFFEILNEYQNRKLNCRFISINQLNEYRCEEIVCENFDYDHDLIKKIIEKFKPPKINISQSHFIKFQNDTKFLKQLQRNTDTSIISIN